MGVIEATKPPRNDPYRLTAIIRPFYSVPSDCSVRSFPCREPRVCPVDCRPSTVDRQPSTQGSLFSSPPGTARLAPSSPRHIAAEGHVESEDDAVLAPARLTWIACPRAPPPALGAVFPARGSGPLDRRRRPGRLPDAGTADLCNSADLTPRGDFEKRPFSHADVATLLVSVREEIDSIAAADVSEASALGVQTPQCPANKVEGGGSANNSAGLWRRKGARPTTRSFWANVLSGATTAMIRSGEGAPCRSITSDRFVVWFGRAHKLREVELSIKVRLK